MKSETRAGFSSSKPIAHDASIKPSGRAEFGDFFEQIAVRCEKKGKSRSEGIDGKTGFDRAADVLDGVSEGEGQLLNGGRARLAYVVSGDRDRIPARYFVGAETKHFGDQSHARFRRIDIGSARDVLLQNIVLNCPAQLVATDASLFRDDDVHREQGCRGGIDRHRGRDFVEWNVLHENVHVLDAVDSYASPSDFAERA